MLDKMREFDVEDVIADFEEKTKDAHRVQLETLQKILKQNAQAEYLRNLGLNGRTDPESYKSCVPIVTHQDLEPHIQRIIDGDTSSILTGTSVTTISLSSGTTEGKPKFLPFSEELFESTMQIYETSFAFRNREYPIQGGKALMFIYSSKQFRTSGGLYAGTATTNIFRHPQFRHRMKGMQSQCCSPDDVIFGPDFHQSVYCHLLCGVIHHEEIQFVSSTFAHSIVHAFEAFEQVWEQLCTDIREGTLSDRVTCPSIQASMAKLLKPNPELADLIYNKCSNLTNWYGLIPELFPNAKYVYGIMTGSMEPYLKKLRRYAGWLPLVCADYGSTEGWIAANVNPHLPPESATFAVLPDIGYYEFIPLMDTCNVHLEPEPVGLTEVEVGEEYEVIITTFAGLYRYRLGDAVKVMGFHNSTPELKFICRKNLLLSVNIDKNTEKDLQLAVQEASKCLMLEKVDGVDFTSHVDRSTEPGHYVIFWELASDHVDHNVLQDCCNCLDRSFADAGYVSSRKVGSIGPLELRVVHRGTFRKILEHFLNLGAAMSQYKTPRCVGVNNKAVLQILVTSVCFGSSDESMAEFRSSDEDDRDGRERDQRDVVFAVTGDSRRKRGTGCLVYWRAGGGGTKPEANLTSVRDYSSGLVNDEIN
ncbi:Jasmonoyl--L-amino acid synthetase JAR6-like protein [Drosera capensis]